MKTKPCKHPNEMKLILGLQKFMFVFCTRCGKKLREVEVEQ